MVSLPRVHGIIEKKMREFKEIREKKDWEVRRPKDLDLSPYHLQDLADFLYCKNLNRNEKHLGGLHIHEVYFTADGNYYFKAFEYDGKLYSRLDWADVEVKDFAGKVQMQGGYPIMKPVKVGLPDNLITECLGAEEIIEKVKEWKESGNAEAREIVDENDLRDLPDKKRMRIKWFNKEGIDSIPLSSKKKVLLNPAPKLTPKQLVERQKKQINKN